MAESVGRNMNPNASDAANAPNARPNDVPSGPVTIRPHEPPQSNIQIKSPVTVKPEEPPEALRHDLYYSKFTSNEPTVLPPGSMAPNNVPGIFNEAPSPRARDAVEANHSVTPTPASMVSATAVAVEIAEVPGAFQADVVIGNGNETFCDSTRRTVERLATPSGQEESPTASGEHDQSRRETTTRNVAFTASLLVMVSFILTITGNHVCDFLRITGTDNNGDQVELARGIWQGDVTYGTGCQSYRDSTGLFDTRWRSARAFSVLADIVGGFAVLAILPMVIPSMLGKKTLAGVGSLALKACLFQGLTLLLLTSSACNVAEVQTDTCVIDKGAKLSISATVLWFVAGLNIACAVAALTAEGEEEEMEKKGEDDEEQPQEQARDEGANTTDD